MDLMKTAPLQELADALHLQTALHLYEGRDALIVTSEIPTSGFPDRGPFEVLQRNLRDAYGANVTLELSAGPLQLFALDDDPDGLYRAILTHTTLTFFLKVDKRPLLQVRGYAAESCAFLLFLFPEALHRALDVPLMELESGLLADFETATKIIILVPEWEIELRGPHLEIVGGRAQGSTVVSPLPADVVSAARDLLKWVHYELTVLTPMHLEITSASAKKGDTIAEVSYAQWMLCSLLYLANHSRFDLDRKQWKATFAAERNSVPVDLDAAALNGGEAAARAIGRRTRWVYEGDKQVADRLTIAQNVIAHVLEDSETSVRTRELVRQAEEIAKRVEGGWKAFIGQKLDKYFGQIKQLEDTVDSTSRAYDEQVQALTKALIDSMLAAVGVVIGSFIAAMFKSPFQKYVFWFGTGVYLVYLVAFPIGVGLSVTWIRFRAARAAFATRRKAFEGRLTPEGVDEIVGKTVERRETVFGWWFALTIFLYTVVISALLYAIVSVPSRIQAWNEDFRMTRIQYGMPAKGEVPILVYGTNFDKDKPISAIVGNSVAANATRTLTVYGTGLVAFSVPEAALQDARVVTVTQGTMTRQKTLPPR